MIRQIDETGKPLPMTRINELKLLELMTSPYNQSLIAMIRVELDIAKKTKELKRAQQQLERNSRSKFSLPKHLSSVPSRLQMADDSESRVAFAPHYIDSNKPTHNESDSRITQIVNIKPSKKVQSSRSNNDVA